MNFRTIAFLMGFIPLATGAQTLTLEECKQLAHENYPAVKRYQLIAQSRDFTIENAAKGWFPQISASVGGAAFTDMVKLPSQFSAAGMDTDMKNWMANAYVAVNQPLYDGGAIAARKRVAEAEADVETHQLNVTMYDLNQRIEQLFFGILMYDEQIEQARLLLEDLAIGYQTIATMMQGGIANQSDLDAVRVEQVRGEQRMDALKVSRKSYLTMLGTFIGRELNEETITPPPYPNQRERGANLQQAKETTLAFSHENGSGKNLSSYEGTNGVGCRPEVFYYDAQKRLIDAQKHTLDARLRPSVSAFGMGMVHSQVSDMVNNGMLAGGVTLSWNIGALYTRKNDLRKLDNQRQTIDAQRETFLFNNRLQNENISGNIANLNRQIAQDDEIVRLRESIRNKSEKKVQLGTESVNEMLRDINAVSQARQQKALHEIQLLQAIYQLRNITNEQ